MFREEYQAVCGAAKKKVEFLEKNPLGYVTAAFLAGMCVGLGCLLMGVISNAMNILGVDTNVQTIITGAIIVGAVVLSNINNIRKK